MTGSDAVTALLELLNTSGKAKDGKNWGGERHQILGIFQRLDQRVSDNLHLDFKREGSNGSYLEEWD